MHVPMVNMLLVLDPIFVAHVPKVVILLVVVHLIVLVVFLVSMRQALGVSNVKSVLPTRFLVVVQLHVMHVMQANIAVQDHLHVLDVLLASILHQVEIVKNV
jgi:hypothetical protein